MAKENKSAVSANQAMVEFPRDQWGITSELRKAGLRAASSIRGDEEKMKTFLATLRVLGAHAAARFNGDGEAIKARAERIAAREASAFHRVASHGVAPVVAPAKPVEPAQADA